MHVSTPCIGNRGRFTQRFMHQASSTDENRIEHQGDSLV